MDSLDCREHATYARLRSGEWGLRIKGLVSHGQRVTVVRRDGTTKGEVVGNVLWQGDGVALATILPDHLAAGAVIRSNKPVVHEALPDFESDPLQELAGVTISQWAGATRTLLNPPVVSRWAAIVRLVPDIVRDARDQFGRVHMGHVAPPGPIGDALCRLALGTGPLAPEQVKALLLNEDPAVRRTALRLLGRFGEGGSTADDEEKDPA